MVKLYVAVSNESGEPTFEGDDDDAVIWPAAMHFWTKAAAVPRVGDDVDELLVVDDHDENGSDEVHFSGVVKQVEWAFDFSYATVQVTCSISNYDFFRIIKTRDPEFVV